MQTKRVLLTSCVILIVLLLGCATPQPTGPTTTSSAEAPQPAQVKRIMAAIMSDPPSVNSAISQGVAFLPGIDALEQLAGAGAVVEDNVGVLHPQLADAVPTLDNGLWQLLPDGQMDMTWRIRPGAVWQDGTPLVADDLIFTLRVGQEKQVPAFRNASLNWIQGTTAADDHTLVVHWSQPYIGADRLFSRTLAYPLPRHLLEQQYEADKAAFPQLSYWSRDYVGAGPYRITEWVGGSHLMLTAFDRYVLGRPHIDEIQVRFIPDPNTLLSNILAGGAELSLGRSLSVEQALQVRQQWKDGTVSIAQLGWLLIFPQMMTPDPAVVGNTQFRRALLTAIDRQAIADTLMGGLTTVADTFVFPKEPVYEGLAARAVHYPYDPARASQLIEGLRYTKGSDGAFRDNAGEELRVELRTVMTDVAQKATFAVANDWQSVGVRTDSVVIPPARQGDLPYRALFPGFQLFNLGNDPSTATIFQSSTVPLPENGYVGANYARLADPAYDALIERYLVTVPKPQRVQVLGQIVEVLSEQLHAFMPLIYNGQPTVVGNRLANVTTAGNRTSEAWNAPEWDLK